MADYDDLALVLADFARTMLTEFPIQRILDHLVLRIVEVLDVSGAGVTLIDPGGPPRYVAASGESAMLFERLQSELGEGPCVTAYETGVAVAVPDLAADTRYARFGPAALAAGLAAVFTFPLRHDEGRLGALDLYCENIGGLDARELLAAQTLADVASAYLINAQARQQVLEASELHRVSALHDALTGLPNRTLLQQRLAHAAERALRTRSTAAVLFADLDRFKRVNDIYGHAIGDALLVSVAERLKALIRPGDTLARVSGDEFVILCEDLDELSDGERLAERLFEAFSVPFVAGETDIIVTASVGVAYSGPGGGVSYQLVIDADTAMYQAKRLGGAGHRVLDLHAAEQARSQLNLEQDLRAALDDDVLELAFQPVVRASDGLLTGVEALLRWRHPTLGMVSPQTAIRVAELSGLIVDIGGWVLSRACRERGRWLRDHPGQPLTMAVNVSARQLLSRGFVDSVSQILDDTHMDPKSLVLEVTEGIFIEDGERAMTVLADLKRLGLKLALDDFGTGYSSLNYLRRFPVDIVKIDQSFVADIGRDTATAAIVSALTHLTHVLGMTITAEGVETASQRDQLVSLGCELAQGYLFAAPMPAAELSAYLADAKGAPLRLP
jgi:diguanylate cyclase (GGDEF)-like protein